jgi:diaminopimelate epimerase
MTGAPIPFVKGHGTGNDFVILSDLSNELALGPGLVAAICDRRRGLGADGILVVRRTADAPEVADQAEVAPYFMDYRNGDGSIAQMCGNGARVFVAYLLAEGLAEPGEFHISTRGGARRVRSAAGTEVCIDMGPAQFLPDDNITVLPVDAPADAEPIAAVGVLMPNPHAVTWVDDLAEAGSLRERPIVRPGTAYPQGVNVEFVRALADDHVEMRVFERGVGETLSCGTGACAAAVATVRRSGRGPAGQRVQVDVPGGSVHVVWLANGDVELHGPAEFVARGTIDPQWWAAHV